ncbi:hypothetical protein NKH18_27360 [Streptomyces sp. M10(2022)]
MVVAVAMLLGARQTVVPGLVGIRLAVRSITGEGVAARASFQTFGPDDAGEGGAQRAGFDVAAFADDLCHVLGDELQDQLDRGLRVVSPWQTAVRSLATFAMTTFPIGVTWPSLTTRVCGGARRGRYRREICAFLVAPSWILPGL